jgi:hypothetical protein
VCFDVTEHRGERGDVRVHIGDDRDTADRPVSGYVMFPSGRAMEFRCHRLSSFPGLGVCGLKPYGFFGAGLAVRGQVQLIGAPVSGAASAFDQATLLEFVNQEDHPGRVEPDELAKGLLGEPLVDDQPGEQPSVPGLGPVPAACGPRRLIRRYHRMVGAAMFA